MEIITTEVTHDQPAPKPEIDAERNSRLNRLFRAARDGNWEAAKPILEHDQQAKTAKLSRADSIVLHLAAYFGQSEFVEKLVSHLTAEELQIQNKYGNTALHYAASSASVDSAKAMVKKNPSLPQIMDDQFLTPFFYAVRWRHPSRNKDMLEYLYSVTDKALLCATPYYLIVIAMTTSECYDICLRLLKSNPDLALLPNPSSRSILHCLAAKPSAFISGSKPSLWKSLICPWMNNVSARQQRHSDALKLVHFICSELQKKSSAAVIEYFYPSNGLPILHTAIRYGVFELVEVCLNYFPDLLWEYSDGGKQLLHAAVEHRRVRIFNHLIRLYGGSVGMNAEGRVEGNNNILHLAARLAPWRQLHSVPGPAFQIQRELQWFKAVDAIVLLEEERLIKNDETRTPEELFFEEHEALFGSAKEWMKDTSNSCMLVATLVTTVAFAAMITVPGGNNNETGMPILSQKRLFLAFSISNALSMISAAISLLMFLSVHTSRYTEEDFLESLPKILLRGLLCLFVAVATMMIAFAMALGMAFHTKVNWAYIPITIVACIPAMIFTRLHVPLFFQTFVLTSGPGIFGERRDPKPGWLKNLIYCFLPIHHDHVD